MSLIFQDSVCSGHPINAGWIEEPQSQSTYTPAQLGDWTQLSPILDTLRQALPGPQFEQNPSDVTRKQQTCLNLSVIHFWESHSTVPLATAAWHQATDSSNDHWEEGILHVATLCSEGHTFSLGGIGRQARNRTHAPFHGATCKGAGYRLQHGRSLEIGKKEKLTRSKC